MSKSDPVTEVVLEEFRESLMDFMADEQRIAARLQQDFTTPLAGCAQAAQTVNQAIAWLAEVQRGLVVRLALEEERADTLARVQASLERGA